MEIHAIAGGRAVGTGYYKDGGQFVTDLPEHTSKLLPPSKPFFTGCGNGGHYTTRQHPCGNFTNIVYPHNVSSTLIFVVWRNLYLYGFIFI